MSDTIVLSRPFVCNRRGWLTPAKPCAEEQTFLGTDRASAADDVEYARKVLSKFRGGGVASVGARRVVALLVAGAWISCCMWAVILDVGITTSMRGVIVYSPRTI